MKRTEETMGHYTPAGIVTQKKGSLTDFMCDCQPEGKASCGEVVQRVINGEGRDPWKPEELVTNVVYALTWALPNRWTGYINGLPCDMWCAVTATLIRDEEEQAFFIQCDKIEHGVARLYEMAMEFAEESPPNE